MKYFITRFLPTVLKIKVDLLLRVCLERKKPRLCFLSIITVTYVKEMYSNAPRTCSVIFFFLLVRTIVSHFGVPVAVVDVIGPKTGFI